MQQVFAMHHEMHRLLALKCCFDVPGNINKADHPAFASSRQSVSYKRAQRGLEGGYRGFGRRTTRGVHCKSCLHFAVV
jgi:hypothetical protein